MVPSFRSLRGAPRWLSLLALLSVSCGKDGPASPTPTPSNKIKVTAIAPSRGSTTTDTVVTITGSGFAAGAMVTLGGIPAASVTFVGSTTLNAVIEPRATAGNADVVVSSGGATGTLANGFTFVAPTGTVRPPVVTAVKSTGTRTNQPANFGDVGESITLAATASDPDTPASPLTYEWSGPGTFSSQSATTTWQVPATYAPVPSNVTVTLKVSKTFIDSGITHKSESAPFAYVFQLHDSTKEIQDLGADFLTLFSRSEVPTDTVLHGFSTTCDDGAGRILEKGDVDNARLNYTQDFSKFRITNMPVTFKFGDGSCQVPGRASQRHIDACTAYTVHWEITYIRDVPNDPVRKKGLREITDGTDYVSAVLQNNEWRLCHSSFVGTSVIPALNRSFVVSW